MFFKVYPWVGFYINSARKSSLTKWFEYLFLAAVLLMMSSLYLIHITLTKKTAEMLFQNNATLPSGSAESLFGLCMIVELYASFFSRTRESLYYFPKIVVLVLLYAVTYMNLTLYGFYFEAMVGSGMVIFGTAGLLFVEFEVPMMNLHDDSDYRKPTSFRPRALLQPFFSIS